MKIRLGLRCVLSAASGIVLFAGTGVAQDKSDDVAGQYIVELNGDAVPEAVATHHGVTPDFVYHASVKGFAGAIPPGQLNQLAKDPRVRSIVPNRVMKAFGKPGSDSAPIAPQVVPAGVQHIGAAPGNVAFKGTGVGVAVIDTGLDFNHLDLQPLGTASFSAFGTSAQDDNGHGTHVGGIVAARDNTRDVVGVAPGATLYAVKVLNKSGSGSDAAVIAGLDWVAQHAGSVSPAIKVATMSLGRQGTLGDNPALRSAIQNVVGLGITVVVAAGNDPTLEVTSEVPATYPEVMAIASTAALGGTSQRSSVGPIAADTASYFTTDGAFSDTTLMGVTVSAPGEDAENISKSGLIQSVGILSTKLGGGTTRMSGTSMATPHVTGVVALMWEQALAKGIALSPEDVRGRIMATATGQGNVPLASPSVSYTPDHDLEGIVSAPGALAP
ncbi:MAG: S8 family serine peptidase [Kiritimatiellae bacterium]|nr:S8 family serine peptidase [Kiritimatiellia bacterium]